MTNKGGRPRKPNLQLEEVAKALQTLEAKGQKPSGEAVAHAISLGRGSQEYKTPDLRRRTSVSAKWVISQLADLAEKHGETLITEKLGDLIRRERGRRNAEARAIGEPERHQTAQIQSSEVAGVQPSQQTESAKIGEVAAGPERGA